jgi:hypothetical protein
MFTWLCYRPIKVELGQRAAGKSTLCFAAGINDEWHGLIVSMSAVPKPATLPMMILGLVFVRIHAG